MLKINIDHHSELARKYGVSSIPTVVIMKDGKELERVAGARPAAVYKKALDQAL